MNKKMRDDMTQLKAVYKRINTTPRQLLARFLMTVVFLAICTSPFWSVILTEWLTAVTK